MITKSKTHKDVYQSKKLNRDVYKIVGTKQWGYSVMDLVTGEMIAKECFPFHADAVKWVKGREEYV